MHRANKSPAFLSQNVSPLDSRRIPPNHLYQLLCLQSVLRQVQPLVGNHLRGGGGLYGGAAGSACLMQGGGRHVCHAFAMALGIFGT